jgi:hypothetical protein
VTKGFYGMIIVVCFKKVLYITIYGAYFSSTFNVKRQKLKNAATNTRILQIFAKEWIGKTKHSDITSL